MATLFGRHHVADYAAWRKTYDDAQTLRQTAGVTDHGVYQADNDPNDVTIYHEFVTLDAAKKFIENPALREAIKNAGVQGEPTFWITNRV